VACPKQARVKGDLPLPPVENCQSGYTPTTCNCPAAVIGWSCEWEVGANKIEFRPRIEPGAGDPVNTPVKVGMRWCQCENLEPTATPGQRLACRDTCPMTPTAYGSEPSWLPITTTATLGFPVFITGEEVSTQLRAFTEQNAQAIRYWDIRPLAEGGFGEVGHVLDDPLRPIISWKVHGITMSKIVEVSSQPVSPSYKPGYFQRAMTFAQGNAFITMNQIDPNGWLQHLAADDWFMSIFCPDCPVSFTVLGMAESNPPVLATLETLEWPLQQSDSLDGVLSQALEGDIQIIEASEMLGVLGAQTAPGQSILRAVAFDPESASVTDALESLDILELPSAHGRNPAVSGPTIQGNEGFALSSVLRSLVMVGGTQDGSPGGEPQSSAWLLDVETNEWTELLHELEQVDDLPGRALGAAFRIDDHRVYVAAERDGRSFLWSYLPRVSMTMIAELPALWGSYERSWLVVSEAGDLIYAASSAEEEDALLARFMVLADGTLEFAGGLHLSTPMLSAPIVTRSAIHAVVAAELTRLEVIDLGELGAMAPGETPTVL
jgi:hypothetical protein